MREITTGSSIFYLILSFSVFLLAYQAEAEDNPLYAKLIVILLSFIAGFRGVKVGSDTVSYVAFFENIKRGVYSYTPAGLEEGKDVGFTIASRILLAICKQNWFPLLVFAAVIYGLSTFRFWEMRKDSSFFVSVSTYYILTFFISMNVMRQFIAVSIVFFATRYIKRNEMKRSEYLKFFGLVLLASSFHSSALLGLLYFITQYLFIWYSDSGEKWYLGILAVVGAAGSVFAIVWALEKMNRYMHYFDTVNAEGGLRLYALLGIFAASFVLYNPKDPKTGKIQDWDRYFLNTTRIYYIVSCAIGFWGYFFMFMDRMALYFWPYQGIYFGIIGREWSEAQRIALKTMIYVVMLYILYQYVFLLNGANHHPYYFCWQ